MICIFVKAIFLFQHDMTKYFNKILHNDYILITETLNFYNDEKHILLLCYNVKHKDAFNKNIKILSTNLYQ